MFSEPWNQDKHFNLALHFKNYPNEHVTRREENKKKDKYQYRQLKTEQNEPDLKLEVSSVASEVVADTAPHVTPIMLHL